MDYFACLKPFLYKLDPETAHDLAIRALEWGLVPTPREVPPPDPLELFGLTFPNRVGLAAGFDKNARAYKSLLKQGFGFVEIGTVTPRPQSGNPKPRLFRLEEDEAIINRLGFNSEGMEAVRRRLEDRDPALGIIGVNIGKNKETEDAVSDYLKVMMYLQNYADYITVNISSPNTPGLRNLQQKDELRRLLAPLVENRTVPLLVKIAPDLNEKELEDVAEVALGLRLNGLIVTNTTVSRPATLKNPHQIEPGGLSGKPVFEKSTHALASLSRLTEGKIPLIGCGGVFSASDAKAKLDAGATLVQLYSSLIYKGFGLVREITGNLK